MQTSLLLFTNCLIVTNVKDFNVGIILVASVIVLQIPATFFFVNVIKVEALY
jgi:uncharacterized membrane protein YidH (DUF202 family)